MMPSDQRFQWPTRRRWDWAQFRLGIWTGLAGAAFPLVIHSGVAL